MRTVFLAAVSLLCVLDASAQQHNVDAQKSTLTIHDSEHHQEIVFKSTGAESASQGKWTLRGNLTLRGQTKPVTVQVTLKDGRYTGEATVKQTDFGDKQRTCIEAENALAHLSKPDGDPISVHGFERQSFQNKHVQSALDEITRLVRHKGSFLLATKRRICLLS